MHGRVDAYEKCQEAAADEAEGASPIVGVGLPSYCLRCARGVSRVSFSGAKEPE